MKKWFLVKVKYTKQLENGRFKRVSEPYLLSALTFTDAESRIYDELSSIIKGEFDVLSISVVDFSDVIGNDNAYIWFKSKVHIDLLDGGVFKSNVLVCASNVDEAHSIILEKIEGADESSIKSIVETQIIDVF